MKTLIYKSRWQDIKAFLITAYIYTKTLRNVYACTVAIKCYFVNHSPLNGLIIS